MIADFCGFFEQRSLFVARSQLYYRLQNYNKYFI